MRPIVLAFCLLALTLVFAESAQALPVTTQLSQMSSEQEEGGTPPGVLDATITVELQGTDLKITIDNDSSYDISAVWLNITGEVVSAVSPAGAGTGPYTGFDLTAPPAEMVDGFGTFSVGFAVHGDVNDNTDLIEAGEQGVMVLLSCADGDCSDAVLSNNANGKAVAAKFINGGPAFGDPNDSAFGASGSGAVVPEPVGLALALAGLGGLVAGRARTR